MNYEQKVSERAISLLNKMLSYAGYDDEETQTGCRLTCPEIYNQCVELSIIAQEQVVQAVREVHAIRESSQVYDEIEFNEDVLKEIKSKRL